MSSWAPPDTCFSSIRASCGIAACRRVRMCRAIVIKQRMGLCHGMAPRQSALLSGLYTIPSSLCQVIEVSGECSLSGHAKQYYDLIGAAIFVMPLAPRQGSRNCRICPVYSFQTIEGELWHAWCLGSIHTKMFEILLNHLKADQIWNLPLQEKG